MSRMIDRRRFLTATTAFCGFGAVGAALAGPPRVIRRPRARPDATADRTGLIARLLSDMGFDGDVSCTARRLRDGQTLAEHRADESLPPASVAKAMTAAYALARLGPQYRFETRVLVTGGVSDGTVLGDIVLVGGGDPTLDSDALAAMVRALKARGIRQVRGGFKVWDGALPRIPVIDPTQPPHVAYNPTISGLILNYNRVIFEWSREPSGYAVSLQARSSLHRADVALARMTVVPRSAPIYTYAQSDGVDQWTVAEAALGQGGARALPVRRPALYAGEVFQSLAGAEGIVLKAPEVVRDLPKLGAEVARHQSAPLTEVLRNMLRYSNNLIAEVVGLEATRTVTGDLPLNLKRSAAAMNAWAREKLGLEGVALVDHSGLGDDSRISAAQLVDALSALRAVPGFKDLLHDYPMRDDRRRVLPDHPVRVNAKTGTLNFVSALAGYATLPSGDEVAFAILTADLDKRDALSVEQAENPPGGRAWSGQSRRVQQRLIDLWVASAAR